ncbi:MAG: general secretion pathway protein GspH [Thiotrichales bacterium]|nr:general secretion pathway protein GspH [Thiotrichales bacterium]
MKPLAQHQQGLTLIELMVVVVIIGILAAIAGPMYADYVRESRRTTAQGQMIELAANLERFFSDNNTYAGFPLGDNNDDMFPDHLPRDEAVHANAWYDVTLPVLNGNAFTIRVDPVAGNPQDGDGFMTLTSAGAKAWDTDDNGAIGAGESDWDD